MRLTITEGVAAPGEVEVTALAFLIGREPGMDLVLAADEEVSREHAALRALPDGRLEVEDLGSTNGTYVDGARLGEPVLLAGGESIRIGNTVLVVEAPTPGATRIAVPGATKVAPPPPTPMPSPAPVFAEPATGPTLTLSKPGQEPRRGRSSASMTVAAGLVIVCSIALVSFMTLNWFDATEVSAPEGSAQLTDQIKALIEQGEGRDIDFSANAWQAFSGFDFLFVIVAAIGLGFGIALLITRDSTVAVVGAVVFGLASLGVALLIASKLFSTPDLVGFIAQQTADQSADAGVSVESSAQIGAILALLAALAGIGASVFAAIGARTRR